jgi:hypothetical protein
VATDRQAEQSLLTFGGGVLLAVSVFLPWYALTITASGVASAQQSLSSVAQQFGNSSFQNLANSVGSSFSSLAGHQLGTVSAHQALKYVSVALLVLAGIAILATVVQLVGASSSQPRGFFALIGFAAAVCVVLRMVERPVTDGDVLTLSLSWGAWLALASSLAIIAGDLWPRRVTEATTAPPSYPNGPTYPSGPTNPPPPTYPGGLSTPPRPPGWS